MNITKKLTGESMLTIQQFVEQTMLPTPNELIQDADERYWSVYYKLHKKEGHSPFATYVYNLLNKPGYCLRVVDVGCGNLRDSIFFAEKGFLVTGIDYVSDIKYNGIECIKDDFVSVIEQNKIQVLQDVIYMRFFLHAVPYDKGEKSIDLSFTMLKPGGLLCIEVRSTDQTNIPKNSFVKGDAYVSDHSRWLYTADRLKSILKDFELVELKEENGFSPTPMENPVLLRAIARKPYTPMYELSKNYPLYKQASAKSIDYVKSSCIDLVKFNKIIEDNKLQYTVVGGTLLGLQRHGGAIPWDSDIDIGLTQENFQKLIALKTTLKLRINTRNKHYHLGTLDIFLLEENGEWYEGENETYCHKDELATLRKQVFGKTYVYAPVNSFKTLERKYGTDYYRLGMVKGQDPFILEKEDRTCI